MVREVNRININKSPELLRLVEAVRNAQAPLVLEQDNEDVAIVRSIKTKARGHSTSRPMTFDDPLWKLVGSAKSAEATDASKKDEYVAEALAPQRE
jgi:hypothetical protein